MEFSRLERAAIEAILSKSVDGMDIVRSQFAAASVVERDYTGAGFYTTISVPSWLPPMADEELLAALSDGAIGRVKSDPEGWILFMLCTDVGYLTYLEGCTVRIDSWPDEDEIVDIVPCEVRRIDRI